MLEIFGLLFSWMPSGLAAIAVGLVVLFVLAFFIGIIVRIIEIIRG